MVPGSTQSNHVSTKRSLGQIPPLKSDTIPVPVVESTYRAWHPSIPTSLSNDDQIKLLKRVDSAQTTEDESIASISEVLDRDHLPSQIHRIEPLPAQQPGVVIPSNFWDETFEQSSETTLDVLGLTCPVCGQSRANSVREADYRNNCRVCRRVVGKPLSGVDAALEISKIKISTFAVPRKAVNTEAVNLQHGSQIIKVDMTPEAPPETINFGLKALNTQYGSHIKINTAPEALPGNGLVISGLKAVIPQHGSHIKVDTATEAWPGITAPEQVINPQNSTHKMNTKIVEGFMIEHPDKSLPQLRPRRHTIAREFSFEPDHLLDPDLPETKRVIRPGEYVKAVGKIGGIGHLGLKERPQTSTGVSERSTRAAPSEFKVDLQRTFTQMLGKPPFR
jgi:hypothetical protein